MVPKTASINLLKGQEKGFIDKFITWALSIGRIVVILTETIALLAFLYRFSLDRELVDIHDKIKQKEAIVQYLKPNEDKYRNLQTRLRNASELGTQANNTIGIMTEIIQFAPSNLRIVSIVIDKDTVKFEAQAPDSSTLTRFINALKQDKHISSISIDKIENKPSSATLAISITTTLKKSISQ